MSNELTPCRACPEVNPVTGLCLVCDHASCAGCLAPVAYDDAHPVHWVPGHVAPGILCLACLAADGDSGGVPVETPDDDTSAVRTVRQRTLSDQELVALAESQRRAA